jgi:hypothetical protein
VFVTIPSNLWDFNVVRLSRPASYCGIVAVLPMTLARRLAVEGRLGFCCAFGHGLMVNPLDQEGFYHAPWPDLSAGRISLPAELDGLYKGLYQSTKPKSIKLEYNRRPISLL